MQRHQKSCFTRKLLVVWLSKTFPDFVEPKVCCSVCRDTSILPCLQPVQPTAYVSKNHCYFMLTLSPRCFYILRVLLISVASLLGPSQLHWRPLAVTSNATVWLPQVLWQCSAVQCSAIGVIWDVCSWTHVKRKRCWEEMKIYLTYFQPILLIYFFFFVSLVFAFATHL
jgi:hypothetical protein